MHGWKKKKEEIPLILYTHWKDKVFNFQFESSVKFYPIWHGNSSREQKQATLLLEKIINSTYPIYKNTYTYIYKVYVRYFLYILWSEGSREKFLCQRGPR